MWDVLYQEVRKLLRINEIILQEHRTQLEREGLTKTVTVWASERMIAVD